MKAFAELYMRLDQTNSTREKVAAMASYFSIVDDPEKLWTIALLSHRRPKRPVNTTQMKEWAAEAAGIPFWLMDETHHIVGDLAETIASVLPIGENVNDHGLVYWIHQIRRMRDLSESEKREHLLEAWNQLTKEERFVFNKIITGGFRVGV